jgi:hypothetical protein
VAFEVEKPPDNRLHWAQNLTPYRYQVSRRARRSFSVLIW